MSDHNGDTFTYAESTSESSNTPVFTSKQWAYQIDQNNGNYSSKQIQFDLSGFYNSQKFINPQEMFIVFPVISTMTSVSNLTSLPGYQDGLGCPPDISGLATDNEGSVTNLMGMGYKSGYWHLINGIQIQVDGKDVIQMTPNINFHASFVANTTWSETDVKKHGVLTGFHPDSCDSWKVNATGDFTSFGYGVCNNALPPVEKVDPYPTMQMQYGVASDAAAVRVAASRHMKPISSCGYSSQSSNRRANMGFYNRMLTTNGYDYTQFVTGQPAGGPAAPNAYAYRGGVNTTSVLEGACQSRMVSEPIPTGTTGVIAGSTSAGGVPIYGPIDSTVQGAIRQLATTCVVRFKDICDLFSKLPLTRGLYMRVTINLNTGYVVVGASAHLQNPVTGAMQNGDYPAYSQINQNTFPGTCPIMLAPLQVSALAQTNARGSYGVTGVVPASATAAAAAVVAPYIGGAEYPSPFFDGQWPASPATAASCTAGTSCLPIYPGIACDSATVNRKALCVSVSIAGMDPIHNTTGYTGQSIASSNLTQCRIYAPIIDMEPSLTNSYISSHKDQAIYYRDVLYFVYPSVTSNFTYQVANGITNAKRLIIIPHYRDTTTVGTTTLAITQMVAQAGGIGCPASIGYSGASYPLQKIPYEPTSPFDSAPATTAPQPIISDFNVLISNQNVFQRQVNYGFENYIGEMSLANSINGGLDTGVQSGLVDQYAWENNYRYYVVDLSRRLAGDNTPKSITIIGSNKSAYPIDLVCFVEYERHLSLDVESGHISISSN